ncbi:MAG TPA: nuclear transport factor 2 family protein [Candidatus Acidoferrum sp.]|nr:nuclear transport factor 2 family protein [Candidatus Acidoferrum sp.]
MRKASVASVVLVVVFAVLARAQDGGDVRTPEQVVQHHWEAFTHRDVEAVLSDYADDAIFIAANQTVQGKAALRQMFTKYLAGGSSAQASPSFEVKITADGDVGYEHWVSNAGKPGALEGTDAFVVRHGKILFHTVVGVRPLTEKQ